MPKIRYTYQTIEFDTMDIHVKTLKDKQQYDKKCDLNPTFGISSANWSLFGVIWPSAIILANLMDDYNIKDKRILEVGCGIALSSLVLNHRNANITTTDFNPEVEVFLTENTRINNGEKIPFECANWANNNDTLGKFDLIIASDVLYEKFHLEDLSRFLNEHTNESCEIIIVDPGRGNHAKFSKMMVALGYVHSQSEPLNTEDYLDEPFNGQIIKYSKKSIF
ncbi:MAG: histidine kinase [Arcobacter sp.]|uniref:class I SAM-dependent methyltransferase n=1 Tax=uncultured Arcobacter sp. TaxID=165434 RepID=UPI000CAB54F9|nr:methyltransferase domain-containing protein [uncultured Arcobacter sp.]PLY10533.1 MAG: histidine kinase [Arcobacter sp.]